MDVRRAATAVVLALTGLGCGAPAPGTTPEPAGSILVSSSPSPFSHVSIGPVAALVPDGWEAAPAANRSFRGGFVASPHPHRWRRMDGRVAGMSATWVDASRVGVPSDFYYLAATGPMLSNLTSSHRCRPEFRQVFADHRPRFTPEGPSEGDYVARGGGTCRAQGADTRWAYFVAAPGYGPVRSVGIPASGLYVVVAVTRDGDRAGVLLDRLIRHTTFGGSTVEDMLAAAGGATRPA